jgi:hypothetical protein
MEWITLVASVVLGLVANEVWDLSPWLARRVAVLAARVWSRDPRRRETYAEEWQALVAERPGKLLKLLTAVGFLGSALVTRGRSAVVDRAVLTWLYVGPSLRTGYSRRHTDPPRGVPLRVSSRRLVRLRRAMWAGTVTARLVIAARVLAARTRDPYERSEALLLEAIGLLNLGRDDEFAEALERTRLALQQPHRRLLPADIDILAAFGAARHGQYDSCITLLSAAAARMQDSPDAYHETVYTWSNFASVCSYIGLHEHAVRTLQLMYEFARLLGLSDSYVANPGIHLRRALSYDHRGDTPTCVRLLQGLVEEYETYQSNGGLHRMRSSARCAYGYAMARLAAFGYPVNDDAAADLLRTGDGQLCHEMRVLGTACLAIARGRPTQALAEFDANIGRSAVRMGLGELPRIRAVALEARRDLEAARAADRLALNAVLTERAVLRRYRLVVPHSPFRRIDESGLLTAAASVLPAES